MKMTAGMIGAAVMAAFGTYYFQNKKRNRKRALLCKALATAVPGILLALSLCGILNGGSESGGISGWTGGGAVSGWAAGVDLQAAFAGTLAAIVFYMAADVLLECRFIWGAVCFGIGHICMAAGFLLSGESVLHPGENGGYVVDGGLLGLALALCALFAAAACAALHRYFHSLRKKKLLYPLLVYVLVLSMMAALAVTAGVRIFYLDCYGDFGGMSAAGDPVPAAGGAFFAARGLAAAAGGLCFAVSDVLLGRNRLGKRRSTVCGALVLILYYAAVYLFAMRLWL